MNVPAIEFLNVSKSFRQKQVLDSVRFTVPQGAICGLLGSNGSGKSTSMKILLDLVRPSEGRALVLGMDANNPAESLAVRRRVACVTEDKSFYPYMTVQQVLDYARKFFNGWNTERLSVLLKRFELDRSCLAKNLSKGNRAKLALTLALCRSPEVLILDEPTEGLDPLAREDFLQELVQASLDGVSILICTHQLAEVEKIIGSIVLLEKGKVLLHAEVETLKEKSRFYHLTFRDQPPAQIAGLPANARISRAGRSMVVSSVGERWDWRKSFADLGVEEKPMTLQEIYGEVLKINREKRGGDGNLE